MSTTNKIIIKKNPNGDTRTAPKGITIEQFKEANDLHRGDVCKVMMVLSSKLKNQGVIHDWTKTAYEKEFYRDFLDTMNNGANFVNLEWAKLHYKEERHHPTRNLHEDYNLLDLIETVVDCTVAGLARSGEVRPMEFNDEIIKLAVNNTVKLIQDMVQVEE